MPRVEAWQVDLDPGRDYVRVTRGIGAGDDAAVARILVPDKEGFEAGGHPGRWAELFVARDGCRRLDDGAYEVDVCGENESVYGYVVSDDADGFRHSARTGDEIVARPWDPGPDCGKAPSRQPAGGEPDRSLTRALPSLSRRLEEEVVRRRLPDVPDAPDGSPGMEPGV